MLVHAAAQPQFQPFRLAIPEIEIVSFRGYLKRYLNIDLEILESQTYLLQLKVWSFKSRSPEQYHRRVAILSSSSEDGPRLFDGSSADDTPRSVSLF